MKHCRAILIFEQEPPQHFRQSLADAGITNVSETRPTAITTGLSFRTKLDLYVYLAGELSEPPDFGCIQRLRRSNDPNVAFAPMMLVAERLTPAALKAAVDAGFDDILLHPFGASELQARLIAAITSPHAFYASPDYAGPDRRRGLLLRGVSPERRGAGGRAVLIMIERSIAGGCRVRRTERLDASAEPDRGELLPA